MSAEIFNQLNRFRRERTPDSDEEDPDTRSVLSGSRRRRAPDPSTSKVKRALFGPVDHEENIRFVRRELERGRLEASKRWNYDFENDRPESGRYEWESVSGVPERIVRTVPPNVAVVTALTRDRDQADSIESSADQTKQKCDSQVSTTPATESDLKESGNSNEKASVKGTTTSRPIATRSSSSASSSSTPGQRQSAITGNNTILIHRQHKINQSISRPFQAPKEDSSQVQPGGC